ncbi:hypothetical protein [Paenibacillus sp. PDC88]|uniref:hypothetical protein n=1 Tax=Paenibacillus sp. PDC88 TaxID=1884375 RepID=UPI00089B557C|nr:hypothetical protein [Paenibacillus sp. PDC88]SDW70976.1 hypothetical protein SAMN05518848_102765 [Paenibacillus sp. PDC88]
MNENEKSVKFSKFVLWVIISTIAEIISLYVLSLMNPHDDGFNAYFRSASGFLAFCIKSIIPPVLFGIVLEKGWLR